MFLSLLLSLPLFAGLVHSGHLRRGIVTQPALFHRQIFVCKDPGATVCAGKTYCCDIGETCTSLSGQPLCKGTCINPVWCTYKGVTACCDGGSTCDPATPTICTPDFGLPTNKPSIFSPPPLGTTDVSPPDDTDTVGPAVQDTSTRRPIRTTTGSGPTTRTTSRAQGTTTTTGGGGTPGAGRKVAAGGYTAVIVALVAAIGVQVL